MTKAGNSQIMRTITLLITIFSLSLPAYAQYSGGMGEPNDPYQIATAEDLMLLGEIPDDYDKHFILTADIDLDPNLPGRKVFDKAVIAPDVKSNDYLSEFQGTPFTGVFDGNDYTISNLTIVGTGYLGLFGRLESRAQVRNVGVVNVNIIGSGRVVGGLVGFNYDGTVAQCYSTGAISGTSYVGGLVGDNGSVYTIFTPGGGVTESYSDSTVDGSGCVGGLVGGNWLSIATSYSTGIVNGTGGAIGGLVGYNRSYGDITYCYASCSISVGHNSNRIGGLVGDNFGEITQCFASGSIVSEGNSTELGGLVGDNFQADYFISSCFWDIETSGLSESDGGTGLTTAQMQDPNIFADADWDFVHESDGPSDIWAQSADGEHPILWWQLPESQLPALPSFSGGMGGAGDPYLISTPHELDSIGYNPRLMAAHFKLIEDIDLADVKFFIIGNEIFRFSGIFDGNGHTISNFNHTSINISHTGLFGYIDGLYAEVKNLGLSNPNVVAVTEGSSNSIGSLVGRLENGIISACYVQNGSVLGSGRNFAGGLAGISSGTIIDCSVACSVSGMARVGGLAGSSHGTIADCKSSGEVFGNDYVGGLLGSAEGTITECVSSGNVSGNDSIGGLIGVNSGEVTYCYSSSDVLSSGSEAGGLIGENRGTITDSYATGNTSGNNIAGGLVGSNGYINQRDLYWEDPGQISNCYSTGSISGTSNVGGLLGRNVVGSITSSLWDMETSSQDNMCGIQDPKADGCDNTNGKTTSEMQDIRTYQDEGWDFWGERADGLHEIWRIPEGGGYPVLSLLSGYIPPQLEGHGTPDSPYLIFDETDLGAVMYYSPSAHYRLAAPIDLSGIRWGMHVIPRFEGTFDGNNLTISHLTIEGYDDSGLFGFLDSGAEDKNMGLVDDNITGLGDYVGSLLGHNYHGTVTNCYSDGTVSGGWYVGGLLGFNGSQSDYDEWACTVTHCYSTATVRGLRDVGGLVGRNKNGNITTSYSNGTVIGNEDVGGLVGYSCNWHGSIVTSYSTGAVSGNEDVGGLVGFNYSGPLTDCYSTSEVNGIDNIGGLVGATYFGSIDRSYSTGAVTGEENVGGFVGYNPPGSSGRSATPRPANASNCFWDTQNSGFLDGVGNLEPDLIGAFGKTTVEMQTASTFLEAGWDFVDETSNGTEDIWWIFEGQDYPRLWWEDSN